VTALTASRLENARRSFGLEAAELGGEPYPLNKKGSIMTLCPIAMAVGCKKCPAFSACPLKGVIGDHKPDETHTKEGEEKAPGAKKRRP
jgi:hypothetical protein